MKTILLLITIFSFILVNEAKANNCIKAFGKAVIAKSREFDKIITESDIVRALDAFSDKAFADFKKARADFNKAFADFNKARADMDKVDDD